MCAFLTKPHLKRIAGISTDEPLLLGALSLSSLTARPGLIGSIGGQLYVLFLSVFHAARRQAVKCISSKRSRN